MTEINLAQLKAANDTKNDESNTVSTTTADDANNSESEKQKQKENNELLQQLKDQEEKLAQSLKDKESEVTRLALENEETGGHATSQSNLPALSKLNIPLRPGSFRKFRPFTLLNMSSSMTVTPCFLSFAS